MCSFLSIYLSLLITYQRQLIARYEQLTVGFVVGGTDTFLYLGRIPRRRRRSSSSTLRFGRRTPIRIGGGDIILGSFPRTLDERETTFGV